MFRHQAARAWRLYQLLNVPLVVAQTIACVTSLPKLTQAMFCKEIYDFLQLLKSSPSGAVFNPWWQVDKQNDIGRNAPGIRRRHLRAYLRARLKDVRLAVIGEALGYRGGHFSG